MQRVINQPPSAPFQPGDRVVNKVHSLPPEESGAVVLQGGYFCFPGDIGQCLQIRLVVITREVIVACNVYRPDMLLNSLPCTG